MENIESNNMLQIIKGIGIAFIITLILLFIFSLLLTYTDLSESIMPVTTIAITTFSILIASTIICIKIKKNGIVNGAIIGGIYICILYVISSIISGSFMLNTGAIIMVMLGIITGAIGGIIGVNTKKK